MLEIINQIEDQKEKGKKYLFLLYSISWEEQKKLIERVIDLYPGMNYVHGGMGELKLIW